MSTRFFGRSGGRKGRRLLVSVPMFAAVALASLYIVGSAQAVHELDFQLDGDVSHACPTGNTFCTAAQKDWADFFDASGSPISGAVGGTGNPFTNSAFKRDFRTNPGCSITGTGSFCTHDTTTYATGSKDTLNITPGWQCNF